MPPFPPLRTGQASYSSIRLKPFQRPGQNAVSPQKAPDYVVGGGTLDAEAPVLETMSHERLRQSLLGLGRQGRRTAISISTLISGV